MKFRARKRFRLGPLYWIFTQEGLTSWGVKIGPYSWNAKTGPSSLNLPGPGSLTWGGTPRTRRAGRARRRGHGDEQR